MSPIVEKKLEQIEVICNDRKMSREDYIELLDQLADRAVAKFNAAQEGVNDSIDDED